MTEPITSSTSRYWMSQMTDIKPNIALRAAVELSKTHASYLTLAHLREACAALQEVQGAAYREFEALPCKPVSKEVAKEKIKQLREELNL